MSLKIAQWESLVPTEDVQLPSQKGTEFGVRLRKPDVLGIMTEGGDVPNFLKQFVSPDAPVDSGEQVDMVAALPSLLPLFARIAMATLVEPVPTPELVSALALQDKMFITEWSLGKEFGNAVSFRQEAGTGVDAIPTVQGVQPIAE